jgi:sugar phosphate isomerase/epimerase
MPTYPGAPPERVVLPLDLSWQEIWARHVQIVGECLKLAEDAGFVLAIEPLPGSVVPNTDSFLRLADALGTQTLGMIMDTAHLFVQKDVLPVSVEKLGDRLLGIHVCDNDGRVDNHWPPGKGNIDWESFLATLVKTGYQHWLSMEINVADNPDKTYAESKALVEEILATL